MSDYPVKLSKFHPDDEKNHRRMIDKDLELNFQLLRQQKKINDKLEGIYTYLTEDKLYYVNSVSGNNENDGSSATPLKTIQAAVDKCPFNLNGHSFDISLYPGNFNECIEITTRINGVLGINGTTISGSNWFCGTNNNYNLVAESIDVYPLTTLVLSNIVFKSVNENLSYPDGSGTRSTQTIINVERDTNVFFTDCFFGKTGTESNTYIGGNRGVFDFVQCADTGIPCDGLSDTALPAGIFYLDYNTTFSAPMTTGAGEMYFVGNGLVLNHTEYENTVNCSFSNGTITNLSTDKIISSGDIYISNTGSNGKLGIGTISPTEKVNIYQYGNNEYLKVLIENGDTTTGSNGWAMIDVMAHGQARLQMGSYSYSHNNAYYAGHAKVVGYGNGIVFGSYDAGGIVKVITGGLTSDKERFRVTDNGIIIATGSNIYSNAWTDYSASSTIIGWSSFITKSIYYKKIGGTVFVNYFLYGTSNSGTSSFTLPFQNNSGVAACGSVPFAYDNGSPVACGIMELDNGTSLAQLYKSAFTNWVNSGTKIAGGQFFYET